MIVRLIAGQKKISMPVQNAKHEYGIAAYKDPLLKPQWIYGKGKWVFQMRNIDEGQAQKSCPLEAA